MFTKKPEFFEFTRAQKEEYFKKDVRNCTENGAEFGDFLQEVLDCTYTGTGRFFMKSYSRSREKGGSKGEGPCFL
ncbi:hypothetical protein [Syntrophomonas erecta]